MRFTPFFLALVLLLPACGRREKSALSSDDKLRRELPGIWFFVAKYEKDSDHTITITVAPDGSYVSIFASPDRKLGPRTIRQEGSWRVEDGLLIETVNPGHQGQALLVVRMQGDVWAVIAERRGEKTRLVTAYRSRKWRKKYEF